MVGGINLPPAKGSKMTKLLYKFLKNGSSNEMAVDGSVTPVTFRYAGPNDGIFAVRIIFLIVDAGIGIYDDFGGISGGLTNGLTIKAMDATRTILDFLDGETIKRNAHFSWLAGADVPVIDSTGNDVLAIRWTIEKAGERLRLKNGESIDITVSDDLTPLTSFTAMLQGLRA